MKQNYIYIGYQNDRLKNCIYLSRFFQVCGYQVFCERLIGDSSLVETDEQFDINIFLSSKIKQLKIDTEKMLIYDNTESEGYGVIEDVVDEMKAKRIISEDTFECLHFLCDVFQKNNLVMHEYNCEYYFYDKEVNETGYEVFNRAISSISDSLDGVTEYNINPNIIRRMYAKYYLEKRKIEKLKDLEFDIKEEVENIFGKLLELQRLDDEFVSVYMLIGDALILNLTNTNTAMDYYNKYFITAQKSRCASSVYYRCGRVLEIREGGLRRAYKAYYLSYDIDNNNYRAAYKLALYYTLIDENTDKVLELYGKIINALTELVENGSIQPIEIEYLFKTLFICGKYYGEYLKSYGISLDYFEKAEKMKELKIDDLFFMNEMYGGNASEFLKRILDRFPMRQIEINKQFAKAAE